MAFKRIFPNRCHFAEMDLQEEQQRMQKELQRMREYGIEVAHERWCQKEESLFCLIKVQESSKFVCLEIQR